MLTLLSVKQDPREKPVPDAWREPIDLWLAHLISTGASEQSVKTRRDHGRRIARALGSCPSTVTGEQLIAWAARQKWARETRRSVYYSARSLFGYLLHADGLQGVTGGSG